MALVSFCHTYSKAAGSEAVGSEEAVDSEEVGDSEEAVDSEEVDSEEVPASLPNSKLWTFACKQAPVTRRTAFEDAPSVTSWYQMVSFRARIRFEINAPC